MKELILLGRGSSAEQCTYDAEVWCASSVLLMPEIKLECISKAFAFDVWSIPELRESVEKARAYSIPVISTEEYASEPYPLQQIKEEFNSSYFRPTVSYMLALAIYRGYEKLKLYGIDQGPEWIYLAGKPYVTFWLGVATGRGIEYELSSNCLLLEPFVQELKKKIDITTWRRIEGAYSKHL